MTNYAIDKNIRLPLVIALTILAVLTATAVRDYLTIVVTMILSVFNITIAPPEFVRTIINGISALAIVFIYIRVFNKAIWPLLSHFTSYLVPNFSGIWHGYITERRHFERDGQDDRGEVYRERIDHMIPVHMTISQDFFQIGILFQSETESDLARGRDSDCTMAEIDCADARSVKLNHTFRRADMVGEVRLSLQASDGPATLAGNYSSSKQRIGYIELVKASRGIVYYCAEVKRAPNPSEPAIVAAVDPKVIRKFVQRLRTSLGKRRFDRVNAARIDRMGNEYRVTLIGAEELSALSLAQRKWLEEDLVGKHIWIELSQVRRHRRGETATYFVATESTRIDRVRQHLALELKELNLPLGLADLPPGKAAIDAGYPVSFLRERARLAG